ncbi:hypothetical protein [Sphingomonas solaris]|uniref:Uncharacterized protein n=1 Tax=Alterirhizorhabdus solaris TaxID=2529389 RepID=A0A558R7S1_9SPHN|nr:hypothetical protein [Sphingomonas solaris]TVV75368.1 hypothetical protein FOY91_07230 [Sphingomonas solaris]
MKRGIGHRVRELKVTLWTLIVPPTLWAAHFLFSYLWAAISCEKVGYFARFPITFAVGTGLALVLIVASGLIAWAQTRTPGTPAPHDGGTDIDRLRFIAYSTMLLAGLSFVAVVFTAIPVMLIGDCR